MTVWIRTPVKHCWLVTRINHLSSAVEILVLTYSNKNSLWVNEIIHLDIDASFLLRFFRSLFREFGKTVLQAASVRGGRIPLWSFECCFPTVSRSAAEVINGVTSLAVAGYRTSLAAQVIVHLSCSCTCRRRKRRSVISLLLYHFRLLGHWSDLLPGSEKVIL